MAGASPLRFSTLAQKGAGEAARDVAAFVLAAWRATDFRRLRDFGSLSATSALGREMLVAGQWRQVLPALKETDLHPMPLKGAVTARCYPRPELRIYTDLDVMMPGEEIRQAQQVLVGLGYGSTMSATTWSQGNRLAKLRLKPTSNRTQILADFRR